MRWCHAVLKDGGTFLHQDLQNASGQIVPLNVTENLPFRPFLLREDMHAEFYRAVDFLPFGCSILLGKRLFRL
jgi:hypothetical protein